MTQLLLFLLRVILLPFILLLNPASSEPVAQREGGRWVYVTVTEITVQPNTFRLEAVNDHSLITNPFLGMYQAIHPHRAISIDILKTNTSLLIVMMREWPIPSMDNLMTLKYDLCSEIIYFYSTGHWQCNLPNPPSLTIFLVDPAHQDRFGQIFVNSGQYFLSIFFSNSGQYFLSILVNIFNQFWSIF